MSDVFALPNRLDSSGALPLMEALLARRGHSLTLDASGVDLVGALALEVIVAAGRQWEADQQGLTIAQPSDRFAAVCDVLGLCATAPWQAISAVGPEARA